MNGTTGTDQKVKPSFNLWEKSRFYFQGDHNVQKGKKAKW